MIDLRADIIPGSGAAGFELGETIEVVRSRIAKLDYWSRSSGCTLPQAIAATADWLAASMAEITQGRQQGDILYFGGGDVELHFSAEGRLFNISVFSGYLGALWEDIRIGDPLAKVQQRCELLYDDGDEMHYPSEQGAAGVAFIAEAESLEEAPDQVIAGISVYDWRLKG